MHLSRAFLGQPELIVLDEPEAGLDQDSREWLRELLCKMTITARVLVIAHDTAVLPADFARIPCTSDGADSPLAHASKPRDTSTTGVVDIRRATGS